MLKADGKQIAGSVLTGTTALGLIGLFTGNNQNKNKEKEQFLTAGSGLRAFFVL